MFLINEPLTLLNIIQTNAASNMVWGINYSPGAQRFGKNSILVNGAVQITQKPNEKGI